MVLICHVVADDNRSHTFPSLFPHAGFAISQTHATIVMGIISAFVLIYLLSGVFWWTLFSSGFMVIVHAGLRDASMHQDEGDQVAMMGEVAGGGGMHASEQAAFLGDPQV